MSVLLYFNAAAERLIEERGAVEVVSAALVYISGKTSNELYINTTYFYVLNGLVIMT